jgi:PAS domain-containing protein
MGKTVAQVIPKEATSVIMDAIGQAQRTGRCSGVEYMLEMPSGPYWFELSIAKKGDPKAKHGRMIVIVRDISDRKRAFEELRESNDRFSTVMDSLKAAVYVADMETYELLFVNRCTVDLFGEVLGKPCWASIYDGQSGPCEFCRNAQLVDTAGQPSELCVWEINNPKAGGWWEMRDEAIRWIDGRVVRLTIARNINKRKGSVPPRSDSVPPGLPT